MPTIFQELLNRPWPHPDARGYRRAWWSPPQYLGPLEPPEDEWYHYTTATGWAAIQACGELRPFRDYPEQPIPLLWFTKNPIYDFGCLKKLDWSTVVPGQVFTQWVAIPAPTAGHGPHSYGFVPKRGSGAIAAAWRPTHCPEAADSYGKYATIPQAPIVRAGLDRLGAR